MQLAVEFPDKLVSELQNFLQQQDLKQFILEAVEAKFLQEQRKQQQQELMTMIQAIKPVKSPLSSEEMVSYLRDGKDHELAEIMVNHE